MSETTTRTFAEGFIFKRGEKAPEFVVGSLSIKVDEAIEFLNKNSKNGWVNLGIKTGRSGKHYIELDTFEPKKDGGKPSTGKKGSVVDDEDLPF